MSGCCQVKQWLLMSDLQDAEIHVRQGIMELGFSSWAWELRSGLFRQS